MEVDHGPFSRFKASLWVWLKKFPYLATTKKGLRIALLEWLTMLVKNPLVILIGSFTMIQISPLKINPWSWLGKQLRQLIFGDTISNLEKEVKSIKEDLLDEKVSSRRWQILNFSNSCIRGIQHTKEEWDHCLDDLAWYEDYCEKNKIANGVMIECTKYLRETYQTRLHKKDFLQQGGIEDETQQ